MIIVVVLRNFVFVLIVYETQKRPDMRRRMSPRSRGRVALQSDRLHNVQT